MKRDSMSTLRSSIGGRATSRLLGCMVALAAAAGCRGEQAGAGSASSAAESLPTAGWLAVSASASATPPVAAASAAASATSQLADPTSQELTTKERTAPAETVAAPSSADKSTAGTSTAAKATAKVAGTPGHSTAAAVNPAPKPAAALIASAPVTGEGYRTYLQLPSPLVLGRDATVTVHLEPQAPFKSNDKYPYRFTVGNVEGASAPSAAVTAASVTPTRTTLRFPITAKSVGRGSIAGTFSFSVCTEAKCLVERAPLVLGFEVVADAVSASPHP